MKKRSLIKLALLVLLVAPGPRIRSQNVGINSTGAVPDASALLDVDAAPSNNKGILIPRVALTQTSSNAPVGPGVATSLLVYNTATMNDVSPGYYYWDGTKWVRMLGANNAWLLTGNAGTVAGTNFIGTTDSVDWVVKTNNGEKMRVLAAGNVGIGTSTPETQLHIVTENTTANPRCLLVQYAANTNNSAFAVLRKSRGSYLAPAAVQNGDQLGTVLSEAYDGTAYIRTGAGMKFSTNGTVAAGSVPTDIFFNTGSSGLGTERMRILSTGEVGIGTPSPAGILEAVESSTASTRGILSTQYTSSTLGARLMLRKARGTLSAPTAVQNGDNTGLVVYSAYNGSSFIEGATVESKAAQNWAPGATGANLIFTTTSNNSTGRLERMRIDDVGRVGIGTATPTSNLEVWANDFQTSISVINASSTVARNPRVNIYDYGSGGGGVMQFNVARGTSTAPVAILTGDCIGKIEFAGWNGAGFPDGMQVRGYATENWSAAGTGAQFVVRTVPNGTAGVPFDRFCVDHNGNVGVNTLTPAAKMHIYDPTNTYTSPRLLVDGTFTNVVPSVNDVHFRSNCDNNPNHTLLYLEHNNPAGLTPNGYLIKAMGGGFGSSFEAFSINAAGTTYFSGNVGIGSTTPSQALHVAGNICYTGGIGACSDARYKKDLDPIGNALEKVLAMKGLTYYWRTEEFPDQRFNTQKQIGFIAQDLEKIFPELVITDPNGYKSVDYAKLTPILVEAIKEQQKIIESQQAAISGLQAENTNFKTNYEDRLKALEAILGSASAKK